MIQTLPLKGRRIVVTRNEEASGALTERLQALGADVIEMPLIRVDFDIDADAVVDVFREIAHYEWIIFTSANGVRYFFETFFSRFEDIRSLGFMRTAVVGKATAEALRSFHIAVDLMPEKAHAEALLEKLKQEQTLDNLRILIVTGNLNRDVLEKGLEEERAIVDTLRVYSTQPNDLSNHEGARRFREEGADALIFASSSAVKSFGDQAQHLKLQPGAKVPKLCSFGPITTATMKKAKIPVAIEAKESTVDSLVDALITELGK